MKGNFDGLWIVIAGWLRVLDVDVSQSLVGREEGKMKGMKEGRKEGRKE